MYSMNDIIFEKINDKFAWGQYGEFRVLIMKSNGFWALETQFQIKKLHLHSHLFTSEKVINFPGRKFKLEKEISYSKKEITETIFNTKANITLRNFPDTVENIRKKLKITEGGDLYYFFTTNKNEEKIVLICTKI